MYTYHERVLDGLAGHGLIPTAETSPQQVRDALRANLCRCGTHLRIVRAVMRAAQ